MMCGVNNTFIFVVVWLVGPLKQTPSNNSFLEVLKNCSAWVCNGLHRALLRTQKQNMKIHSNKTWGIWITTPSIWISACNERKQLPLLAFTSAKLFSRIGIIWEWCIHRDSRTSTFSHQPQWPCHFLELASPSNRFNAGEIHSSDRIPWDCMVYLPINLPYKSTIHVDKYTI